MCVCACVCVLVLKHQCCVGTYLCGSQRNVKIASYRSRALRREEKTRWVADSTLEQRREDVKVSMGSMWLCMRIQG